MKLNSICLCITNYKKEAYLDRAIRSCQSQIQQNFNIEIILVNDGSPKFLEKSYKIEYPEIKIINYKSNKGVSYASNKAINYTKSEYFMRVDADDYLSIRACIILLSILENNQDIPYVYGDITKISNPGNQKIIKRNNKLTLMSHGAGILFRTKIIRKIGLYNNKIKNCEDFDLISRIIKKYGNGFYVPISYYRYYKNAKNHLTNSIDRKKILNQMKKKYFNEHI